MTGDGRRTLGGFRILAEIKEGRGEQGSVYRAVCEKTSVPGVAVGDVVALKAMPLRGDGGRLFEQLQSRTDILCRINHPNVVRYRGCFSESAPPFSDVHVLVMELLEGETLKQRLAATPGGLDVDEAIRIVKDALAGLEAAADAGIVHRDVKPGNIFICKDGAVKLIDFEVAISSDASPVEMSGCFAGTFDYMAPEFTDRSFGGDARSDVFSMGVVMHEALTGEVPYAQHHGGGQADFAFMSRWQMRREGKSVIQIRSNVIRLLAFADEVLSKALAENPADRYATPGEFVDAINKIRFRDMRHGDNVYRMLRVVGRGGFGEVFKARNRTTGELVAIKHLLKAEYGDRFRREANVMRKLNDPAFVRFLDYFTVQNSGGDEAFIIMSYLPGMPGLSLRDAIKRWAARPLRRDDVIRAFMRYACALATMHDRDIYHRDIKPSNLYYPVGNPDASVIMDLGIARDVSGSITTGQVPGTLDYMPPEIVTTGSRGDAGMDIYALGLCLYEALTGKTAYPRLPVSPGQAALEAFFRRAYDKIPPKFDDPGVVTDPALLSLLEDMTAIDPSRRIQDARVLFRRLSLLLDGGTKPRLPSHSPEMRRHGNDDTVASEDRQTIPTDTINGVLKEGRSLARRATAMSRPSRPRRYAFGGRSLVAAGVKTMSALLIIGSIAVGGYIGWGVMSRKVSEYRDGKRIAEINRVKAEKEKKDRIRLQSLRNQARSEANDAVGRIMDGTVSLLAAGNAAGEWKLKWRECKDIADVYDELSKSIDDAVVERKAREKREHAEALKIKAEKEAKELIAAYDGSAVGTDSCEKRANVWRQTWKPQIDAETYATLSEMVHGASLRRKSRDEEELRIQNDERRRREELRRAEFATKEQADKLVERYSDLGTSCSAVNASYAVWQSEWGKYRNTAFYASQMERIETARKNRILEESGRAVAAECGKWLDNIATVSSHNVNNWRGNIDHARLNLKGALGDGRISPEAAKAVERRIDACVSWAVGVIDNKTHHAVRFGGRTIPPLSCGTVIFTNGVPDGVAVTGDGYEPLRVREDAFDSNTFVVMPGDMKESEGGTTARIPPLDADVSCLVDGVERHPGELELRQGRHKVVYRRNRMTYPGIRDYKDQEIPFDTVRGAVKDVPSPAGSWEVSSEFISAKKNADLISRGRALVAEFEANLVAEPLETRRNRLEKAYGILHDWQTASALSILGEGVERDLRAKYEAERRRIRGYVRNATALPLTVTTDTNPVAVPPGARAVVTFERKWLGGDAYASVPGYEFVMLPRSVDEFDGKEFVVSQGKLVGIPVAVSLPPLEDGVVCGVQGRRVEGRVNLRPGEYEGEYRKPDCVRQKFRFAVKVGEPLTLPPPGKWEPSGAMSALSEAMSRLASGAVDDAKAITSQIGTIEDPKRRRELEDLRRAIEIREQLEGKNK